jgi:GNAT superfamily N-acetyltransferase
VTTQHAGVSGPRTSLFCDVALAARIERADAALIAAAGHATHRRNPDGQGFVTTIAGGVACFAEPGSPFNKVAGLGFAGCPGGRSLDGVEGAFAARDEPTRVELATLADPAVGDVLADRGYRLEAFENVLGRAIADEPPPSPPRGVEVRPSGDDEFDAWLEVVLDGVASPDTAGVPWHDQFPRELIADAERDFAAAGVRRYIALRDGVVAGGAELNVVDGVAQLAGAATASAHRRHGVHAALMAARIADAAAEGCDIAVITAQPGSTSQHGAQRRGFDLLYARAVLVRQP